MKWLRDREIRCGIGVKIAVCFAVLVILPFILLAFIMFFSFQNYTRSNMSEITQDTMAAIKSELDVLLEQYESKTMALYYGGYVETLSENIYAPEVAGVLDGISFPDTHIHAIYLKAGEQVYHSGATYEEIFDVMKPYETEILQAGGACIWYPTEELRGNADEKQYILARRLNNRRSEAVGILYMILDEHFISEVFEQLTSGYTEKYLTDGNGNILYSAGRQRSGQIDVSQISGKGRTGAQQIETDEGSVTYVYSTLRGMDWYCISIIPTVEIVRDILKLEFPFIVIAAVYLMFLAFMFFVMKKNIFRPLKLLKGAMDDYASSGLEPVKMEPIGTGEFRSLSEHFSKMTARIYQLMLRYREEMDEKNRQKMKALTAQLTPHFIYNALNTIKWIAVLNRQEHIQSLIASLIYIFRNAARVDDDFYTVRDELKLIENYAVIQKARFMNFDLEIEAQEECMDYHIRKFLVQPVVENAIVHGLGRGQEKNGKITLKVLKENGCLYLIVKDNGIGFDVEAWRQHPDTDSDHTNIGLHSVEEIIRLEYGSDFSLCIESQPGEGTVITYRLPAV